MDLPPTAQRAPAKGRILDVVTGLFYSEGIQAVGVDRIITESSVTKATFYKHYRSKENLIVAYISERHRVVCANVQAIIDAAPTAEDALRQFVAAIESEIRSPGFRGCPFINAAAEFADPLHPVRVVITEHREWYVATLAEQFKQMGHPVPGDAADELLMARDGALAGSYAGDSIASIAALGRISEALFTQSR